MLLCSAAVPEPAVGRHESYSTAGVLESSDRDRAPRSVISLTQVHTFLALVEEGSVARASVRLGLGHSTVSAHSKLVAEEFGQRQFSRIQGGLVVTAAGLEAYHRLRPFFGSALFCINYFRSGTHQRPIGVSVSMPFGFPGSLLDVAVDRVSKQTASALPEYCILPAYGRSPAPGDGPTFVYGSLDSSRPTSIRDRWILIRSGANTGWNGARIALTDLADQRILVPNLPTVLNGALSALAERAHASLEWSNKGIHELLARAAQLQNFCTVAPASLVNLGMVCEHFECALLERSNLDPAISIRTSSFPAIAEQLQAELQALLADESLAAATKTVRFDPEPENLSLKHCRSFLALYEEGNVRRAAQRLSIVQPAVTVQLHRIEEQVGCDLFTRSYHGLRANARADALYALLRPLIAEFNAMLRHLRAALDGGMAPVRVGLIPALDDESLTAEGFAAALNNWCRTYNDRDLQVVEGYSSTLVRWLHSGRIDFALIDRVFADPGLVFDQLLQDMMVVVTDSASGLLRPGPVMLEQLARLPLVLPSTRHGLRNLLAQSLREQGLSLQPRIELDSMAACLSLVKIAPYATILPLGSLYKSRDRRGLSVHEIREPRIVRKICLVRSRSEPCSEAAMNFIEELRSAFASADGFWESAINLAAATPAPLSPLSL